MSLTTATSLSVAKPFQEFGREEVEKPHRCRKFCLAFSLVTAAWTLVFLLSPWGVPSTDVEKRLNCENVTNVIRGMTLNETAQEQKEGYAVGGRNCLERSKENWIADKEAQCRLQHLQDANSSEWSTQWLVLKAGYLHRKARVKALEDYPLPGVVPFFVLGAMFAIPYAGMLGFAAVGIYRRGTKIFKDFERLRLWPEDKEDIEERAEGLFCLLLPWFAYASCAIIGCLIHLADGNMAVLHEWYWIFVISSFWIARAVYVETVYEKTSLSEMLREDLRGFVCECKPPHFILTKIEIADFISDGLVCGSAIFMNSYHKRRFEDSFDEGSEFMKGVVQTFGLAGFMALALAVATVAQSGFINMSSGKATALDLAGLSSGTAKQTFDEGRLLSQASQALSQGSVSPSDTPSHGDGDSEVTSLTVSESSEGEKRLKDSDDERAFVLSRLSRTLGESIPQIFLQGSLAMAHGRSPFHNPQLMISAGLTLFTSMIKAWELTCKLPAYFDKMKEGSRLSRLGNWAVLASAVVMWPLLLFAFFRFVMLELCPCHMWGVTTGCRPMGLLQEE